MDRLEQNQAELRKDMDTMGERITQLLETLHVVVQGQEELRQSVAKLANSTPTTIANGGSKPVPVEVPNKEDSHHENNSELEAFKFPIEENERKFHLQEERLKALEGRSSSGLNAIDLCLVPDIKIPAKFKVPSFEKYKGTTCPMSHIKAFCNKMAPYAENDKLLMHFFQDSLSGASLEWYTRLERTHVRTWDELAEAFLKHYKYNSDMAPTRLQLQSLTQKVDESFKEYAQRWRELASRVQPPLLERELVDMFMNTLKDPYLNMMIGCASSEFSSLVVVGERIENALKMGKIQDIANVSEFTEEEKSETNTVSEIEEEEVPVHPQVQVPNYQRVLVSPGQYIPQAFATTINQQPQMVQQQPIQYLPQKQDAPHQQGHPNQRRPRNNLERRNAPLDQIPITYNKLLPYLVQSLLVRPKYLKPPPQPFPPGYDPNVQCGYHAGSAGHSTEDCNAFQAKVQQLIDGRHITLQEGNIWVNGVPLPK